LAASRFVGERLRANSFGQPRKTGFRNVDRIGKLKSIPRAGTAEGAGDTHHGTRLSRAKTGIRFALTRPFRSGSCSKKPCGAAPARSAIGLPAVPRSRQ